MSSPLLTNTDVALNGKTALLAETLASITGGLVPASDAVQVGWMLRKQTTLTNAQIKALPTTPFEVVAAPGAGYRLLLHLASIRVKATAGAYTNINAAAFANLIFAGGDLASNYIANDATSSPVLADLTGLLTSAFAVSVNLREFSQTTTPAASEWGNAAHLMTDNDNKALQLAIDNNGSGVLTGGNAANTLIVTVYYTVIANP